MKANNLFERALFHSDRIPIWAKIVFSTLFIAIVYLIVLSTGGIRFAYQHLIYIPLIFAGMTLPLVVSLPLALAAGFALGPFMPYDIEIVTWNPFYARVGEIQAFSDWALRMGIYLFTALLSGLFSKAMRASAKYNQELSRHHPDTWNPNINDLERISGVAYRNAPAATMTILILNREAIIKNMGYAIWIKLLQRMHKNLALAYPERFFLVQSDENKFWVVRSLASGETAVREIMESVDVGIKVDDVTIYLEYAIGWSPAASYAACMKSWAFVASDQAAYQAAKDRLPYRLNEKVGVMESYYPLLGEVTGALEQGQFFLVYQPQVELAKYVTKGFEALVRWNHPSKGMLSPGIFLPLLEETQLIHPLGEWVLRSALVRLRLFRNKGFSVVVSINVSAKQFFHPEFLQQLTDGLDTYGLPRDALKIEVAEATLMLDPEKSVDLLERADQEGLSFWMDNFGRGQSSLIHLPKLKLEGIKLAPEFWEKLNVDLSGGPVVELAVELARRLGFKIIAESVESARTAAIAKQIGCDAAQGYHYSKPLTEADAESWYLDHS